MYALSLTKTEMDTLLDEVNYVKFSILHLTEKHFSIELISTGNLSKLGHWGVF
jgi:hypothetical protein